MGGKQFVLLWVFACSFMSHCVVKYCAYWLFAALRLKWSFYRTGVVDALC